ncbi:MAG: hypothetical protein SAK29_08730 [Scytonema sp. PMC 1069.18]|nr:hypothetical protein [Scytonema sp. PMC 1069.18]MEC4884570.1 hypothetical protein [Scytonema sp. PMC 1070.18]
MLYLSAVCYCNLGVKELKWQLDEYPENPVDLIKELLNLSDIDLYYLKWEIKDYPQTDGGFYFGGVTQGKNDAHK